MTATITNVGLHWMQNAACKGRHDLFDNFDDLDPLDRAYCKRRALAICARCPVIAECERHWLAMRKVDRPTNCVVAGRFRHRHSKRQDRT